jgi:hypothetical protein
MAGQDAVDFEMILWQDGAVKGSMRPDRPPMSRFSEYVVLSLKDQIRSARYRIRRNEHADALIGVERGLYEISRPVALIADAMFTEVEAAASTLLADKDERISSRSFPAPVEAYFGHPDDEAALARAFTRAFYSMLKALMRKFGAREFLAFEQAIDEAREALLLHHNDLIWSVLDAKGAPRNAARDERITRLCAAITCELVAQRPIKELDIDPTDKAIPKHLLISPNAYCFCVMGLATAIVSLRRESEELDHRAIVAEADLVVDARFDRFSAALRARDPVSALAEQFAAVLPFLP